MKIGDKVRFLSESGGGIIAGFQGNNTVLVEDEDGFEIPTPIKDVVVVDTDDYNIAKVDTRHFDKGETENRTVRQHEEAEEQEKEEEELDLDITYKPAPVERKGGEKLNLILAFVPQNAKKLSVSDFEVYLINDCNYVIDYNYLSSKDGKEWKMRSRGSLDPNTKEHLETFGFDKLDELGHVLVQGIAYKEEKTFTAKPVFGVDKRIDKTKFFKEKAFRDNEYFEEPALLFPVVVDDQPTHELIPNAEVLKTAMQEKKVDLSQLQQKNTVKRLPSYQRERNGVLEVDLHADALLDNTDGMGPSDLLTYQLDTFNRIMKENLKTTGRRIVFIHGKGEGVLRAAIEKELKHSYKQCLFQDASFREYGYGATMVIIRS